MEIWKPVVGWEGLYEVSNLGRVRSVARVVIRSNGWPLPVREKILVGAVSHGGYKTVILSRGNASATFQVHTLVADAFHGPRPVGAQIRHLDGKKANNSSDNIRYGTSQENHQDKILHGTVALGERNGKSKLTAAIVLELRQRYAAGDISYKKLGDEYGIPERTVAGAVGGDTWRWLHG